jgi:hypothetical protein
MSESVYILDMSRDMELRSPRRLTKALEDLRTGAEIPC